MPRTLFPDRFVAAALAGTVVAGSLLIALVPSRDTGAALDLALGLFGGLAAALTFSLALLVAGTDVWPPARALVLRPSTIAWFTLSTLSIGAAVVGAMADPGELHRSLTRIAVAASFMAGSFGVLSIVRTLSAVSGAGRRDLHSQIIRSGVRSPRGRAAAAAGLHDLLPSAAESLASGTFARFVDRGEDLLLAARRTCADAPALTEAERLCHLCLGYEALLARALARHEAVPELSWLLEGLVSETACLTGHVQTHAGTFRGVRLLAGQTRMLNWLASSASARGHLHPICAEEMGSFIAACERAQTHVRACADPDPPLQHLPTKHPWLGGITDCPDATLLWLVAACEHGTQLGYASALYVVHESLFGDKYFGDYQYGRAAPDIQARLRREPESTIPSEALLSAPSGAANARPLFEAWGGVDLTFVTLLAIRLAELTPAHWTTATSGHQGRGWLVDDSQALVDRWRFLVPELQDPSPRQALALAARALSSRSSTEGLDPWRRNWLDGQHVVAPPSVSLSSRPGFVLLAALLALRKSLPEHASKATEQFLASLPDRAVAATLAAMRWLVDVDTDAPAARRLAYGPSDRGAQIALARELDRLPQL